MKTLFVFFFCISLNTIGQQSKNIDTLFHWDDPTIPGSTWYNNKYNDVWGFTINGKEFAVIGSSKGIHFFDITVPDSTHEVAYIAGEIQGPVIVHRDFHDYKGYLYVVADEGMSSLQIIDLHFLPDSVQVVYNSQQLIIQSHNIFIDTATGKLYSCAMDDSSGFDAMNLYSLADPENPTFLYSYNDVGHVHDVYVRNDTAYCNSGTNDALHVVDFTMVGTHTELGSLTTYPDQGYNHSGWLSEDGSIYAFADETHGMNIKICDVRDLTDIKVISQISSGVSPDSSMAHNLMIKDSFLYVSYYHDGLQVFDIRDPYNPVIAGYYDTYPDANHASYRGAWGVYSFLPSGNVIVSDMQTGFYLFDVDSVFLDTSTIPAPVANYSYSSVFLVANFTDLSTNNPTSWSWDFGDGSNLNSSQDPQHTFSGSGSYWVCLTAGNQGGSDLFCDSVLITQSTGIPTYTTQNEKLIFPNPFRNECVLKWIFTEDKIHAEVYNTIGELCWESRIDKQDHIKLDLSSIVKGVYLLKITGENTHFTNTIVKID